jgi:hypothetical protein
MMTEICGIQDTEEGIPEIPLQTIDNITQEYRRLNCVVIFLPVTIGELACLLKLPVTGKGRRKHSCRKRSHDEDNEDQEIVVGSCRSKMVDH